MELEFENYGWSLDEILKVNMLLGFSLNVQKLWFWSALKRFGQISQHNPDTVMLFETRRCDTPDLDLLRIRRKAAR